MQFMLSNWLDATSHFHEETRENTVWYMKKSMKNMLRDFVHELETSCDNSVSWTSGSSRQSCGYLCPGLKSLINNNKGKLVGI